jgi:4-amino-4-deoxy-L-arabinose transferase-like glycosyltransferase
VLAGVGAFALVLRLAYWVGFTAHRTLTRDAGQYSFLATNVAEGRGYVDVYPGLALHPAGFRVPLYPALLSAFYWVFGSSPGLGRAVNVGLGVVVVALTFWTIDRHVSRRAAVVAALAVAISPNLVANDTFTLSEPLGLLLLLLLMNVMLARRWVLAGVLTGALTLSRPSAQYLVAVLVVWVVVAAGWRQAARFALIAVVVVVPWVVRNWVELGSPVLTTSNGYNWAAIYSPAARAAGRFVDPIQDPSFDGMRLDQFDEIVWNDNLTELGQHNLLRHPTMLATVVVRNVESFFEVRPSFNAAAEASDGRSMAVRSATLWVFYLELGCGLVGLWVQRRRPITRLTALVAAYFTVASVLFVAPPRLRAPLDLALAIGCGLLADQVVRRRAGNELILLVDADRPSDGEVVHAEGVATV